VVKRQGASILRGRRVVFVFGNLELGGAERQALILARHLAEHEQATVEVWGFNRSGPVAGICEQHGIRWRVVPYPFKANPLKRFTSILKVARLLREARPDVLLPYTLVPNVVCGLVWKWTGAQLCVWNQRDEGIAPVKANWERWAVKRTPQFISNSRAGARFLSEELNVDRAKVRVVPNGLEPALAKGDRRAWRERFEIDEACFVACMVANLHTNKDHATLLQAWKTVVSKMEANGRSAVLVLAGRHDGAYESLVALTCELRIESSVRFAGQVSDIAGLLSAVDIGVFSSRSEGCPNGVLECMAAGLAVAGTNIEGVREVLGPSSDQLLAPTGDAATLARIVLRLAEDPVLCSTVGADSRRIVTENYDPQRMCEETVALFVECFTSAPGIGSVPRRGSGGST
jgi:glycosyltransferase involved in cell wall biosynthesis